MSAFETWWHNEGSAMAPLPGEDAEMHVRRVTEIAWRMAAKAAREAKKDKAAPPKPCRFCSAGEF